MTLDEKKMILANALLEQRGIQYIVDTATELLGNPMFIEDALHIVLAHSSKVDPDDAIWRAVKQDDDAGQAYIAELFRSGELQRILASEIPAVGYDQSKGHTFAPMRIVNGEDILGWFCVIDYGRPLCQEDVALMPFLAKVIACEMLRNASEIHFSGRYHAVISELIQSRGADVTEILRRAESVHIAFPKEMHVMVAEAGSDWGKSSLTILCQVLLSISPGLILSAYQNQIVALCPGKVIASPSQRQTIAHNVEKAGLLCGISNPFTEISDFYPHYRQACDTVELLHKGYGRGTTTAMYRDMSLTHLLSAAGRNMDLRQACTPELMKLLEYDRKNGTSYTEDLRVLLSCGRSNAKAAKMRNLHRNSMYYRIDQIEQIMGRSLKDDSLYLHLSLSFQILDYLNT